MLQNDNVFIWGNSGVSAFRRLRAVAGVLLIGFGLTVLLVPRILEALVASFFILSGLGVLSSLWAWRPDGRGGRMREVRAEVRDDV